MFYFSFVLIELTMCHLVFYLENTDFREVPLHTFPKVYQDHHLWTSTPTILRNHINPFYCLNYIFCNPFVTYHPTQVGRLPGCILPNHSKHKCFCASFGNGPFPCVLRKPTLNRVHLEFPGKCYSNRLFTSRLSVIIYLLYSQLCFMLYRGFRPRKI